MRFLLDTHALLWWLIDARELSSGARKLISEAKNQPVVSASCAWEIATKFRLGRLPSAGDLISDFSKRLEREGFGELPISIAHCVRAGLLPGPHRDPFDRMLAAQAQAEELPILSKDVIFDRYGVQRIW